MQLVKITILLFWFIYRLIDDNHRLKNRESPINTDTIIELDPDTGDIVRKFGKNMLAYCSS